MNRAKRLNLNLATFPRRNRHLFFLFLGILGAALALALFFGGTLFINSKQKTSALRRSLEELDNAVMVSQREGTKFSTDSQEATKKYGGKVNLINSLILRKSFSWIEVFSLLEESLPDSSYILSLNPALTGESQIELRLKVASPSIEELLQLIKNLKEQKFDRITVNSEMKKEGGPLVSEISFAYEKHI